MVRKLCRPSPGAGSSGDGQTSRTLAGLGPRGSVGTRPCRPALLEGQLRRRCGAGWKSRGQSRVTARIRTSWQGALDGTARQNLSGCRIHFIF